jgi:site-specific DNA recombinase
MIGSVAKSGKFSYYRCNHALRHGPDACRSGWLPKDKIEGFVIEKLKEKLLTEENLTTVVQVVNEEISLLAGSKQERLSEIERQLDSVGQKLLRYYTAFEKGTMTDEDQVRGSGNCGRNRLDSSARGTM